MNTPTIKNPCPKLWSEMTGDKKRRFCRHCQLHVHNLVAMDSEERREVLSKKEGVCIRYEIDAQGQILPFADSHWLSVLFFHFRRSVAALLITSIPFAFSSCAARQGKGKPEASQTDSEGRLTVLGK